MTFTFTQVVLLFLVWTLLQQMVVALPSPTEASTPRYRYWFTVAHGFFLQVSRLKALRDLRDSIADKDAESN